MKDFKEISGAMSSGKTTALLKIKDNYEKSGKIVCFIGENFVQEFGMLASVDKFLKIKSKTFKKALLDKNLSSSVINFESDKDHNEDASKLLNKNKEYEIESYRYNSKSEVKN